MIFNNLTLTAIISSDDYLSKTISSMEQTLALITPARAIIICPQEFSHPSIECMISKIEINYSLWILKHLNNFITTDYCLIQQWDSFVLNPDKWTNEYFNYDYIGALWESGKNRIGNGGFSLRSKKFLEVSSQAANLLPVDHKITSNEDYFMCNTLYNFLKIKGIKFPPEKLARQFSVERIITGMEHDPKKLETYNSFGFHGVFNTAAMDLLK